MPVRAPSLEQLSEIALEYGLDLTDQVRAITKSEQRRSRNLNRSGRTGRDYSKRRASGTTSFSGGGAVRYLERTPPASSL